MGTLSERYATSKQLEEDGSWVDLGDGMKIKVARAKSERSRNLFRKLQKPYQHLMRQGRELPDDVQTKIGREWVAGAILLDWEGITDDDGKEIPYSRDHALQLFEKLPDFLDDVIFFAQQAETFRAESLNGAAKNSESG